MIRIHEPCHSVRIQYDPDKKDCLIGWDVTPGAETIWLDRDELERALQIVQLYPKAMIEKEGTRIPDRAFMRKTPSMKGHEPAKFDVRDDEL